MSVFPCSTGSDHTSLVLNDPDFLLVEFRLEPFLFGIPEEQAATGVADLVNPVLVRIQLSRSAQPCTLGLSLASPTTKFADHAWNGANPLRRNSRPKLSRLGSRTCVMIGIPDLLVRIVPNTARLGSH